MGGRCQRVAIAMSDTGSTRPQHAAHAVRTRGQRARIARAVIEGDDTMTVI